MNNVKVFNHSAFKKLFQLFKKKYYSYGEMRGTVSLKDFNMDELEEIAGFLGVSLASLTSKSSLSLKMFDEKLKSSAFSHFSLEELVETVLEQKLQTKEQLLSYKSAAEEDFLKQLRMVLVNCPNWLAQIEKRTADSRFIWQQQTEIIDEISVVAKAIEQRLDENEFERLPIFAQRTTGNPHAFDANTLAGKLLIHAAYSLAEDDLPYPKTTKDRVDLLATLQIIQDDLWNFVTIQGLYGYINDAIHPVWQAATEMNSALNMPMRELMHISKVKPLIGYNVWVVENSSVASTLMDACPTAPIICTHGQLRMAAWRLFNLLDEGVVIHYSGDLDPEGLLIAQNIVQRYPGRVELWRMDEKSYTIGKSEPLTDNRLQKLQKITITPSVVKLMQKYKKAAYQEAWLPLLIGDLKN